MKQEWQFHVGTVIAVLVGVGLGMTIPWCMTGKSTPKPKPIKTYVDRWDQLRVGMTETQVIALLGTPDDTVPAQSNIRYQVSHMMLWGWRIPLDDSPAKFLGLTNAYRVVFGDDGTVAEWQKPDRIQNK